MKIDIFDIEAWMTEHEKEYTYNLAESCVASLTIQELLDFCQNKEEVLQHILHAKLDYGPIVGSDDLKEGILKLYDTGNLENITITHGCINANELVLISLLQQGDHIITIYPTYQQMYSFPESFGVEVSLIELLEENNWQPTIEEFKELIKENTKMICLTSPNNPTGTSISNDLLEQLVVLAKEHNIYLLVDEAYRGAGATKEVSISDIYDKGIATSSMSKTMGLAGLRIGWIKGPKEIITLVDNRRDYHIISSGYLNDYLATIAFKNYDKIHNRSMDIITLNRQVVKEWLETEPNVSCQLSNTGTIAFLKYDLDMPSKELCVKLQEETGVFFVPGACFGKEYYLRFGMANKTEEIKKGLQIFSRWIKEHKNDKV